MSQFDLAVLGGGPGGYQAAFHAQTKGLKTVLVEKEALGGVCLNWGCIPTKTLLSAAKFYNRSARASDIGLEIPSRNFSWKKMLARKDQVVAGLRKGMRQKIEKAGTQLVAGTARLSDANTVVVTTKGGEEKIQAKSIVIATGSRPRPFPGVTFDGRLFLSSDDALNIPKPPNDLVIVGGGVIGVEFASLFHALGTKVSIVEQLDRLIPTEDSDLGKRLEMSFKRRGITVYTGVKSARVAKLADAVAIRLDSGNSVQAEKVLISIGRVRNTGGLGLESARVALIGDAIDVNEFLETSVKGVYAIGDVTNLPQLAHVASFGATLVVDNLLSPKKKRAFPCHAVPSCTFSDPLVASVGLSREAAEREKIPVKEARVLLSSQGKAHVEGELEGFVKLVASEKDGTVLGGHAMGGEASETIGVVALAVSQKLKVSDLAHTIFPHPTFHELVGDAARSLS